jgi:hypothetical protein
MVGREERPRLVLQPRLTATLLSRNSDQPRQCLVFGTQGCCHGLCLGVPHVEHAWLPHSVRRPSSSASASPLLNIDGICGKICLLVTTYHVLHATDEYVAGVTLQTVETRTA